MTTEPSTLGQQFFDSVTKARAGTIRSVKFSDYVYFLRYYDIFNFTLVR